MHRASSRNEPRSSHVTWFWWGPDESAGRPSCVESSFSRKRQHDDMVAAAPSTVVIKHSLPTLRLTRLPVFRLLQDPIIRRVPGCPILDNLPPPHITTDIFKIFLFCIWLLKPIKSCVTDPKLLLFVFILTTWLDRKTVIKDISYFSKGSQNKFILKFSMNGKK